MNEAEELAVAEALNQLRERNNSKENGYEDGPVSEQKILESINDTKTKGSKVKTKKPANDGDFAGKQDTPSKGMAKDTMYSSTQEAGSNSPLPEAAQHLLTDQTIHSEKHKSNFIGADDKSGYVGYESSEPPPPVPQQGAPQHWRSVLLTATSLVLTKDTRKRLRHLLNVLRLASEHLNTKVNALKEAMESDADNDNVKPKLSKVAIHNDIIMTIKKCLTMLSTLATNSLPAAACGRVRSTLLKLPSRWANQLGNETIFETDGKSESAVLALATETLISIQNITNILAESVDRADSWVEKFPDFRLGKRRRDYEAGETAEAAKDAESAPLLDSPRSLSQPLTRPGSPTELGVKAIKIEESE